MMQDGSGLPVFRGHASMSQYGRGLGNSVGGVLRAALPIFGPMIKNLGKGLVKMGANKLMGVIDGVIPGGGSSGRQQPRRRRRRPPVRAPVARRRKTVKRKSGLGQRSVAVGKRRRGDIFS
jgi:hypothetical protein